jgi:hypothetical protein
MRYFNQKFGAEKVVRITPFHPNELQMPAEKVDKPYFLFHADLSVAENDSAARFLVRAIAEKDSTLQLVIAGKRPSKKLQQACEKLPNVSILPNISSEEMLELIRNASANILFAHRAAGVKLKLLFSLFNGRYCIANRAIVNGSGLEELCIALPADENRALATVLPYYTRTFDRAEWEKRRSVLLTQYDNRANAVRLIELLKKRAQQYR